ncbi:hypothetical protein AX774_g3235 [Zancudomyces culisetae]|uniref:Uncharacterized protein n=1 Tax=Zancudomyces culisetae TaxID=1213189 RepID=A0A1R1PQK4_ZANCU|nr:hypothetical protein AX774_g3235 [Zancudomyces culisetae]|eukprot:OMH83265.1 hypothetical protein AX774_g3235 [Zancudomyces culisetae]
MIGRVRNPFPQTPEKTSPVSLQLSGVSSIPLSMSALLSILFMSLIFSKCSSFSVYSVLSVSSKLVAVSKSLTFFEYLILSLSLSFVLVYDRLCFLGLVRILCTVFDFFDWDTVFSSLQSILYPTFLLSLFTSIFSRPTSTVAPNIHTSMMDFERVVFGT